MVRTQISLTEAQMAALRSAAAHSGVSLAELVREAVDAHLARLDRHQHRERMLRAVGVGASGLGNLAKDHDTYAWGDD